MDDYKVEDNDKDDNNDRGIKLSISTLGLDRDLGFSGGHQGHQPPHDDDGEEEVDNEVEDNDKVEDKKAERSKAKS